MNKYRIKFKHDTGNHNWHVEQEAKNIHELVAWIESEPELEFENIDSVTSLNMDLRYPVKLLEQLRRSNGTE